MSSAKSMEALSAAAGAMEVGYRDRDKVASIRKSSTSSRRISAAELEQLMARQSQSGEDASLLDVSLNSDLSSSSGHRSRADGPRVYASVAEMKKARRHGGVPVPLPLPASSNGLPRSSTRLVLEDAGGLAHYQQHQLKSFHSSPDLAQEEALYGHRRPAPPPPPPAPHPPHPAAPAYYARHSSVDDARTLRRLSHDGQQHYQSQSPYSQPFRPTHRPKTPPPPPPPPPPSTSAAPPPPPPPPPPDLFAPTATSTPTPPNTNKPVNSGGADCRGITAAALSGVKLKKAAPSNNSPRPLLPHISSAPAGVGSGVVGGGAGGISAAALSAVKLKPTGLSGMGSNDGLSSAGSVTPTEESLNRQPPPTRQLDFNADLKAALAKRRNNSAAPLIPPQMPASKGADPAAASLRPLRTAKGPLPAPPPPASSRLGLSLKESVQQSGLRHGGGQSHSPPMGPGFVGKKDSGYTSSRNSLEPSECGEEPRERHLPTLPDLSPASSSNSPDGAFPPPPPPEILQASLNAGPHDPGRHRVSILSQQLEDAIIPSSSAPKRPSPPPACEIVSLKL